MTTDCNSPDYYNATGGGFPIPDDGEPQFQPQEAEAGRIGGLTAGARFLYSDVHTRFRGKTEPLPLGNVENAMPIRPKSQIQNPKSIIALCLFALLAGCSSSEPVSDDPMADLHLEGVKLELLVVGDPELAAAVRRLRGEWNALTGSDFELKTLSEVEPADEDVLAADAVICPSYQLGTLAQRKLVAPMPAKLLPKRVLQADAGDWIGVFELLKLSETVWGSEVLAVPFGSPVLTLYYRADLLKKLGRQPPRTWAEYRELAELLDELLDERGNPGDSAAAEDGPDQTAPWCGTIEPLAPGWAGLVLLARAAPYAKHPDNYSTLFDIHSMEPLVAGPPFIRALEELVAAAKAAPSDPFRYGPAEARAAFWRGQCGMALTWPSAAADLSADKSVQVGFAELPGSVEVYTAGSPLPDPRAENEEPHVPLLAVAGRIGVVSRKSDHCRAAFRLLFWLSGNQFGPRVCSSSPATTLFRQSHLDSPQTWVEKPIPPESAAEYGALTERTFLRQQWLPALRIPGRSQYLAALDEAVRRAVVGELSAAESLGQAVTVWGEITGRLGPDAQKSAYRRSLGLD